MVTVIHDVNRKGTGWYILGDRFTSCGRSYTKAHNKGISEGTTTEPSLLSVLSTCYMTTDAWDSLPQDVKIEVKNRVTGIVGSDFARLYTKTTDEGRFYCRAFIPDSIIEGYKEESIIVCTEGEKRSPKTCWDSSTIQGEVCRNNAWVPTGETCPAMPAHGTKRNPTTCWDDSVIYAEVFDAYLKKWVPSGIVCPTEPTHGTKRNLTACSDGTAIHAEIFDAALHRWVPSGETCLAKPECEEGDKKPGHVCVDGKWKKVTVPEPVVPPVEPPVAPPKYLTPEYADERIRAGLPCYIKCVLPLLDMLPGIPYTPGMWVPTFCAITAEP